MAPHHKKNTLNTTAQYNPTVGTALNITPPRQPPTLPTTLPVVCNYSLLLNPLWCSGNNEDPIHDRYCIAVVTAVFWGLHEVKNKTLPISD